MSELCWQEPLRSAQASLAKPEEKTKGLQEQVAVQEEDAYRNARQGLQLGHRPPPSPSQAMDLMSLFFSIVLALQVF